MTDKPTNLTTAMFGAEIACMCCGVKLTAWAYCIDECQECGRKKQERRRHLACMRFSRKQGKRLAEEMQRRTDEAFLAAHMSVDLASGPDRTVLQIAEPDPREPGLLRFRVVEDLPAGIDFGIVPDPIPIKTVIDEDGTVRSEIDVDELRRKMAIAKDKD